MTTHPSPTAPEQDPALAPLLALYATLRGGAPVDPRDLVVAVGMAVCQGADVGPTLRAIGELAFVHLNHLGGADGAYLCAAALEQVRQQARTPLPALATRPTPNAAPTAPAMTPGATDVAAMTPAAGVAPVAPMTTPAAPASVGNPEAILPVPPAPMMAASVPTPRR